MDFLKDNLFYVILVAGIIVVSVPSYILGSQRREVVRRAQRQLENKLRMQANRAAQVKIISDEVLAAAREYNEAFKKEKEEIMQALRRSDNHLDRDFLVEPPAPGKVPEGERYKQAYYRAYRQLQRRLKEAGLTAKDGSPLPAMEDWGARRPVEFDIRVTQKKYWILKAIVDILTDPEVGVVSVQKVMLDYVPNARGSFNHPTKNKQFWLYPVRIEMIIDFRDFPVFLEKMINNEEIFFEPPGLWKMTRAFDETKAVYIPQVSVSFDCTVWDYIQTNHEKANLVEYMKEESRRMVQ